MRDHQLQEDVSGEGVQQSSLLKILEGTLSRVQSDGNRNILIQK